MNVFSLIAKTWNQTWKFLSRSIPFSCYSRIIVTIFRFWCWRKWKQNDTNTKRIALFTIVVCRVAVKYLTWKIVHLCTLITVIHFNALCIAMMHPSSWLSILFDRFLHYIIFCVPFSFAYMPFVLSVICILYNWEASRCDSKLIFSWIFFVNNIQPFYSISYFLSFSFVLHFFILLFPTMGEYFPFAITYNESSSCVHVSYTERYYIIQCAILLFTWRKKKNKQANKQSDFPIKILLLSPMLRAGHLCHSKMTLVF